ncbi:unnamed protein product [Hydatigera taeniaeformis]|uniref:Carbohydrate sulfotransferase n=1 Tax=Hydatigena taeniaeformis TaxID=6205 RepID=A0A0R3WP54_HYDTA|nr:unnamed protein product [Hydatigera taeniaeformis]
MEVTARRLMSSKRKTLGLGIIVIIVYAIYVYVFYFSSTATSSPADTPPTVEESKIRANGSSKRLRFEELAGIPDAEWLHNFDPSVYLFFPQSTPVRETLQSLIDGKPFPQVRPSLPTSYLNPCFDNQAGGHS